jgi:hypothetical protein
MAHDTKPGQDPVLRAAAAAAGMTPQKYAQLSGRTTVSEYEALAAAERKNAAGDGDGA